MAVISISITESTEQQVISGIPKSVSLSVNIPSTIFYTVDGTTPTTNSQVYIGPIYLPTNNPSVLLQMYATNGVDYSPVISKSYGPQTSAARMPHDTVIGLTPKTYSQNNFPYGSSAPEPNIRYGNSGGITVDSPNIENIPDGYDGTNTGTRTGGTDLPLSSYDFKYSTSNSQGETGPGIGTLPGKATIRIPPPIHPSSSSKTSDKLFNPRAMVIYQDSRELSYDDVSQLNRMSFSLQNVERVKNGAILLNTGNDSSSATGSFLKSHYNPRDNTITYYYRDSDTNQWIISKEPWLPKNEDIGALYKVVFSSREQGSGYVYKWIPFMSRRLI